MLTTVQILFYPLYILPYFYILHNLYFVIQIMAVIFIVIVFSKRMITENIVKLEKNKVNQDIYRIVNTLDKELEYIKNM